MSSQLSDEQLAALERTESCVAAISGVIIRAIRNSGVSDTEIAKRADMAKFHVNQVIRSPACNGTIEDLARILATIGIELKVDIAPIEKHKETVRHVLDPKDFTPQQWNLLRSMV